jgi:hypothetical protein
MPLHAAALRYDQRSILLGLSRRTEWYFAAVAYLQMQSQRGFRHVALLCHGFGVLAGKALP